MATSTAPPDPLDGAGAQEVRDLRQFSLYLGSALTAAGEAVNRIEDHPRRVASAYGAPQARVSVLPTYLVVALEPGRAATLEPTRQLSGTLRLDQTAALFDVLRAAERGTTRPAEGIRQPIGAAFLVAALTFVLAGTSWADADLRAMVAPLVTFLPGAMLTVAVVELSAAEMITGASRLVAGSLQLVLLAFGIIGAVQTVGVPRAQELHVEAQNSLGGRAPWLGALIVGIGSYLLHSGLRGSLRWLCLVLYAGWIGQYVGNVLLGGHLSGFVGAVVLTFVAYLVARRPSGPPALVSFLPGFWLLERLLDRRQGLPAVPG